MEQRQAAMVLPGLGLPVLSWDSKRCSGKHWFGWTLEQYTRHNILMGCWLHYQLRVSLILFLQFGLSSSILQHCTVRVSPWQVQIWLWETHAQKQSMKHERLVCDLIRRPPQHCFHGLHILALPKFSSFHSVAFNPRKGEPPRHCKSCSCSVKHSLYSDLEGIEEPNDLHLSTIHHKQR